MCGDTQEGIILVCNSMRGYRARVRSSAASVTVGNYSTMCQAQGLLQLTRMAQDPKTRNRGRLQESC